MCIALILHTSLAVHAAGNMNTSPKLYAIFFHVKGTGKRAVWTPATGPNHAALISSTATADDIKRECTAACLLYGFDGYRTGWGMSHRNVAWNGRVRPVSFDSVTMGIAGSPYLFIDLLTG